MVHKGERERERERERRANLQKKKEEAAGLFRFVAGKRRIWQSNGKPL